MSYRTNPRRNFIGKTAAVLAMAGVAAVASVSSHSTVARSREAVTCLFQGRIGRPRTRDTLAIRILGR
jgi:hypothetical protein